jgi:hypothetical protein
MQAATETSAVVEVAVRPGKVLTHKAAAESPAGSAEMDPAKAAAHMSPAESAADMRATTETAGVSTTAPVPAATARQSVSGHSPGQSGSRSQNDHCLT